MDWKILLVNKELSVKEALKRMDKGGNKILFVVDNSHHLLGVITDGNIRRYIISHGKLKDAISNVYNPNPMRLEQDYKIEEAKELMIKNKIETLPIVDKDGKIVDAINWTNVFGENMDDTISTVEVPVVIMAGGKGERLDPFTRILPKPLIPIGEKPVVEVIIDKLFRQGAKDFYLTLNYKGEMVKIYFDTIEKRYKLNYIWEKETNGTAASLKFLPKNINETFIVSNCDIIVEADYGDLVKFHKEHNNILTVVGSIQHHKLPYGVIHFGNKGKIKNIEEKPEFDFMINTGVYILSKKVLKFIPSGSHFDMTDLIEVLLNSKKRVGVYPVSQKSYIDVGQWEEYKKNFERFII